MANKDTLSPALIPGQTPTEPGAESPPPVKGGRKKAVSPKPKVTDDTPLWTGFREAQPDPFAAEMEASKRKLDAEAGVAEKPGHRWYRAKRDCGSGKYRSGKPYLLPEGQPKELFEELD